MINYEFEKQFEKGYDYKEFIELRNSLVELLDLIGAFEGYKPVNKWEKYNLKRFYLNKYIDGNAVSVGYLQITESDDFYKIKFTIEDDKKIVEMFKKLGGE